MTNKNGTQKKILYKHNGIVTNKNGTQKKNTLQTQWDSDKQKWNTEKNTLQKQWDSDKQTWNTEKINLQNLQTQNDKQKLKSLVKKDFAQISSIFKPLSNNHSRYVNEKECLDYAISINSGGYTKQSWDTRLKDVL